jgi:GNAT superfamily N-acetyltransferase
MTERVGVLNDHFLGRNHPLGEARLLWEIGEEGARVRELRRRLGLDSAYVSRLLRSLEKQGLIVVRTSENDRRVRQVQLTFADPTSQDARWCFEQYFTELGERFDTGFDPTLSISAQAHELTPPAGLLLVARLREEPVGCGALKFHENAPGELKRMWVAPRARGLGLGRRLLLALEHYAREAGIAVLHLETNRTLIEAIELYRHSGYQEVEPFNGEPYAHHWFEKRL